MVQEYLLVYREQQLCQIEPGVCVSLRLMINGTPGWELPDFLCSGTLGQL
jgi:hypothetical protein